jgi:tRNA modification GTPase
MVHDVVDSATMSISETIAAISTPPGVGAIAIVRLSGPLACPITKKLFSPSSPDADGKVLRSHRASYGIFHNANGENIDEVVVTPFLKPHSYTGEDVVEISSHGSPLIAKKILACLLDEGARLARAGEFTERAFLNGRIDLTQAEAVLDLIQSKTARQSRNALSILSGDLGRRIGSIRSKLLELLTNLTAGIDFPDEVGETPSHDIDSILNEAIEQLLLLAGTARSGKFLREGLKVAIVGRPNAGKSSLLNQLLKNDRAIVSDQPGTTRDSIEELLDMNGLPVILIDTAGIRHTKDQIEQMGMERTARAINDAEVVLHVVDATQGWQSEEEKIAGMTGTKPWFLLHNKIDLLKEPTLVGHNGKDLTGSGLVSAGGTPAVAGRCVEQAKREDEMDIFKGVPAGAPVTEIKLSAKTGEGLATLTDKLSTFALGEQNTQLERPTLNERQASLCAQTVRDLEFARKTVKDGMPQDCLATDLKTALDRLSEISGEMVSEEVIASVFANFCIGK